MSARGGSEGNFRMPNDEPTLLNIHTEIKTVSRTVQRMDKLLTGGDELEKGLIYQHNKLSYRVGDLEDSERTRRKLTIAAVTAAIGSSIVMLFEFFRKKLGG
jgi:hypothetical protein